MENRCACKKRLTNPCLFTCEVYREIPQIDRCVGNCLALVGRECSLVGRIQRWWRTR